MNEEEFSIDFSSVQWIKDNEIWSAQAVAYSVGGGRIPGDRNAMNVTVSVRAGEWLDPRSPVTYHDPLLTEVQEFAVNGLTLKELAAEKILAWCSKQLVKHAVDLAYLARDHAGLDVDKAIDLTRRKFAVEGGAPRYRRPTACGGASSTRSSRPSW